MGKNTSDAKMFADSGSVKKPLVSATTGSHFSFGSWYGKSSLPMLPETSNAKARCTGERAVSADAVCVQPGPAPSVPGRDGEGDASVKRMGADPPEPRSTLPPAAGVGGLPASREPPAPR